MRRRSGFRAVRAHACTPFAAMGRDAGARLLASQGGRPSAPTEIRTGPLRLFAIGVALLAFLIPSAATRGIVASDAIHAASVRFAFVDVYLDSGAKALAAYQFEFAAETGTFKPPPYYDPHALSRDHIIVAAFNVGDDLPKGSTRVARLHLQISGDVAPQFVAKVTAAATADGQRITPIIKLVEGASK